MDEATTSHNTNTEDMEYPFSVQAIDALTGEILCVIGNPNAQVEV